jgi:hypothetical protein
MEHEPLSWTVAPAVASFIAALGFWWWGAPAWACVLAGLAVYSIGLQQVAQKRDRGRWSVLMAMMED